MFLNNAFNNIIKNRSTPKVKQISYLGNEVAKKQSNLGDKINNTQYFSRV